MSGYLGARISLISQSDMRYSGILHEVNAETATLALKEVVCHGTEGRKGNPAEEVAGSNMVHQFILFKGSEVKDLSIEEPAAPPAAAQPSMPPQSSYPPPPMNSHAYPEQMPSNVSLPTFVVESLSCCKS